MNNNSTILSSWSFWLFISVALIWWAYLFPRKRENDLKEKRAKLMQDIRLYHLAMLCSGIDYIFSYGKRKFSGDERMLQEICHLEKMQTEVCKYYAWYNDIGQDFLFCFIDQIAWTFRASADISTKIDTLREFIKRTLILILNMPRNHVEVETLQTHFNNLKGDIESVKVIKNFPF